MGLKLWPWMVPVLASVAAVASVCTVWSSAEALLRIWRTDDLKSMGMLVPFVSFALILRIWRQLGWQTGGSWWGLAVLVGAALLVLVRERMLLVVTVGDGWLLQIPPLPLVAVTEGAGLVLLLGGRRLLRAARFPVLLLWAVIPVPQSFSSRVDLPLQHAAATVACGFAGFLGTPLTADRLHLMFTPGFGFFIAPGCDGIRGAVTLGLAALVVAHLNRFGRLAAALGVVGGVALGYVFNLLRLCALVLFGRAAVRFPALQPREPVADHLVGGALFVCALWVFFSVAECFRRPADPGASAMSAGPPRVFPVLLQVGALVLFAVPFAGAALRSVRAESTAGAQAIPTVPERMGAYRLVRTFRDTEPGGRVVYTWGAYAAADALPVAVGFSPLMDVHDVSVCHLARGEEAVSRGRLRADSAGGTVDLTTALYRAAGLQTLEASTVCQKGACREFGGTVRAGGQRVTLLYAPPRAVTTGETAVPRPVPVLLKVEGREADGASRAAELEDALDRFLRQANLPAAAASFGEPGSALHP